MVRRCDRVTRIAVLIAAAAVAGGCGLFGQPPAEPYPGVVFLHTGVTTRSEVLGRFGAPSIVARTSDGRESWAYERGRLLTDAGREGATTPEQRPANGPVAEALAELWPSAPGRPQATVGLVIHFDLAGRVAGYATTVPRF